MKKWKNDALQLRPSQVAKAYLSSTCLPDAIKRVGEEALVAFRAGNVSLAKEHLEKVTGIEYDCPLTFLEWAQFKALFIKSSECGTDSDRQKTAVDKFKDAEAACRRVNRRMRFYWRFPNRENPVYRVILTRARELIRRVLGEFTPETLDEIFQCASFGPGAALGTRTHLRTSLPFKLGECEATVTEDCLPYALALFELSPNWASLRALGRREDPSAPVVLKVVPGNRVAFVPKDASTMRTIAVEPLINMHFQLGVHNFLLPRLRRVGVDLRRQDVNQTRAREGAEFWETADPLVTLDLAQASDSVSCGLVERLLPTPWVSFLRDIRSPSWTMGSGSGAEHGDYAKWSSMGNGYTFVLESLIFWALARSVSSYTGSRSRPNVYGDDIIVRRNDAALLTEVLGYCGFKLNRSKSFFFGPFRESCGQDWCGRNLVTPVYLRGVDKLVPTDCHRVWNGLRRLGLHSNQVERLIYNAHHRAGIPLLRGKPTRGDGESGAVFTDAGPTRWSKDLQVELSATAVYRPHKVGIPQPWAYAAALFGGGGNATVKARREAGDEKVVPFGPLAIDALIAEELEAFKPSRAALRSRGEWHIAWRPVRCAGGP